MESEDWVMECRIMYCFFEKSGVFCSPLETFPIEPVTMLSKLVSFEFAIFLSVFPSRIGVITNAPATAAIAKSRDK